MTLYVVDPRGSVPVSCDAPASSSSGYGVPASLDGLEPGVYEARSTGPSMVCFGKDATDGGTLVLPEAPARIIVEEGENMCVAAMSDACVVTFSHVVEVPAGLIRKAGRSSSTPKAVRERCGA